MFYSVYGEGYFLAAYGVCCAVAIGTFLAAAFAVVTSIAKKKAPTVNTVRFVGAMIFLCAVVSSLSMAILSGFEFASLIYTSIACAVIWASATIPIVFMWGSQVPMLFNRIIRSKSRRRLSSEVGTTIASATVLRLPSASSEEETEMKHFGIELDNADQRAAPFVGGALAGAVVTPPSMLIERRGAPSSVRRSPDSQGAPVSRSPPPVGSLELDRDMLAFCKEMLLETKTRLDVVGGDVKSHPLRYSMMLLFGLLSSTVMLLATFGVCQCSQPKELTTWLTRKASTAYCSTGAICHTYPLLGKDCTELVIVSHVVLSEGESAVAASLTYQCSTGTNCSTSSSTPTTTSMRIWPHDDISEDVRFLAATVIRVDGATRYNMTVSVTTSTGAVIVGRRLITQSISCTTPMDNDGLAFIGGGDYRSDLSGRDVVSRGMMMSPNAQFFFIGGDLAYANNMRRCYRRWDTFFSEVLPAITRRSDGVTIPLLVGVGNHEGGGYLQAATRAERRKKFAFYPYYFPHFLSSATAPPVDPESSASDPDDTLTIHTHAVGDTLAVIVLDSDIMYPVVSQVDYLRSSAQVLESYRDATSAAAGRYLPSGGRRLVIIYHNPAFPSIRDTDNTVTVSVLTTLVPVIEEVNLYNTSSGPGTASFRGRVACVFEHHDHAYKRTHAIKSGGMSTLSAGGVVYIGDGALGATPQGPVDQSSWFLQKAENANHVLSMVASANGTFSVSAVRTDGSVMDSFQN